jgi:hypothetical protein
MSGGSPGGPQPSTVGVDPAAPRPEVGFRLHVPDAWLALDLDPATSDRWVERVIDERVAEHPEAGRHRGHLRRILQALVAEQRAAGVFFSAVLAAGARPGEMIGANLALSWRRLTAAAGGIEWLARHFAAEDAAPGEAALSRSVDVVSLPCGPAVRIRTSLLALVPESSRRHRVAVSQLVIPVPGTPWLGVLVVSTPNLGLADVMSGLADEVAQSIEFLHPSGSAGLGTGQPRTGSAPPDRSGGAT